MQDSLNGSNYESNFLIVCAKGDTDREKASGIMANLRKSENAEVKIREITAFEFRTMKQYIPSY